MWYLTRVNYLFKTYQLINANTLGSVILSFREQRNDKAVHCSDILVYFSLNKSRFILNVLSKGLQMPSPTMGLSCSPPSYSKQEMHAVVCNPLFENYQLFLSLEETSLRKPSLSFSFPRGQDRAEV